MGFMNEEQKRIRVIAVTGATGAIGTAIARQIAAIPDHEVVLICRDPVRAAQCAKHITRITGNQRVRIRLADLSRRSEIQALAQNWDGPLDVLINNAAVTPPHITHTPEGIELQFATNVLGYFWMIEMFAKRLADSTDPRIVNVASYWAGGLNLDDLEFKRRGYDNDAAYRQSKQADRMLTVAFAKRLKPLGISVNACHPGDVKSRLSNDLGFGGHESPDQGARTPVWLALDVEGGRYSGRYFQYQRVTKCAFSEDEDAIESLFAACQSYRASSGSDTDP